jgi:hypothetical protein
MTCFVSIVPSAFSLLPSVFCLQPSAFSLQPSAFSLQPSAFTAFSLLPSAFTAFSLLPSAFCLHSLLPSAFCRLPSAFCLQPSAFCLLPSAFSLEEPDDVAGLVRYSGRVKRLAFALLLVAAACHRAPVPVNTLMMRVDAPWMFPSPDAGRRIRTAPATIISLRSSGEYAELHCWLLEQPDETLYIASRPPRVAAIGQWKRHGDRIEVKRTHIARTVPLNVPIDPLCEALTLTLSGNSVTGNVGSQSDGGYAPVTRLVAPDFESYVSAAQRGPATCPER